MEEAAAGNGPRGEQQSGPTGVPAPEGRLGGTRGILPRFSRRSRVAPTPVWWGRLAHLGSDPVEHSLVGVDSERFPPGSCVDLTDVDARGRRPAGWLVEVRFRVADCAVRQVEVATTVATPRQPLWFAEIPHATSTIPSTSLLAFAGLTRPPGSVVTPSEALRSGAALRDRIAELRWWTRSGLVEVLTVDDALAGQGIDQVLLTVADGLRMLRGWPPLTRDGASADASSWTGTDGGVTPGG